MILGLTIKIQSNQQPKFIAKALKLQHYIPYYTHHFLYYTNFTIHKTNPSFITAPYNHINVFLDKKPKWVFITSIVTPKAVYKL